MAAQTPKVPQIHFRNFQKANAFSHVQQNVQFHIANVTTALRPYRKLQHFAAIIQAVRGGKKRLRFLSDSSSLASL